MPHSYSKPTKRSITIAGHETSISLEPMFWAALEQATRAEGLPLSALVARIDVERMGRSPPTNLTSAIRQWLFARGGGGGGADGGGEGDAVVGRVVEE